MEWQRKWASENKDKVKKHNATFWKKRAEKKLETLATIIAALSGSALAVIGLYVLPILLAIAVGL
jgi:hypothetical protein